ncbi:MAG: hypothetical protein K2K92_03695 [Duncaniella sp.]|nr:hypothetical protein [Duncaniella sp.]
MKFIHLLPLLPLVLTACVDSETENTATRIINYGGNMCFNQVVDTQTGEFFNSYSPNYELNLNLTERLVTTSITNMQLSPGNAGVTLRLPALPVNTNTTDVSYEVTGTDIKPEATSAYTFDKFRLGVIERYVQGTSAENRYSPVYQITYSVNDRYDINVFPTSYDLIGAISSTPVTAPTPGADSDATARAASSGTESTAQAYTVTNILHTMTLDVAKNTATLVIDGVRYADTMSPSLLKINNIPYTVAKGAIEVSTPADVTYQINDILGPITGCTLQDIHIRIAVPSGQTTISYRANITKMQGNDQIVDYDVSTTAGYLYQK